MVDIKDTLTEFGSRVVDDIKDNMSTYGLQDSNLAKSLQYEVEDNIVTVSAAPYFKYAQLGRGPGGVPWNFIDILLDWMERYNIQPKYGTQAQFANAVKWKIIREGSSIYRGDRSERDFIDTAIDDNLEWLEQELYVDIKDQFDLALAREEIHGVPLK